MGHRRVEQHKSKSQKYDTQDLAAYIKMFQVNHYRKSE